MKFSKFLLSVAGVMAISGSMAANAQTNDSGYGRWDDHNTQSQSWMPFTSYGYVGGGLGRSDYGSGGCVGAFPCDKQDNAFEIYTGGQLSRGFGLELGYINFGRVNRSGGSTDAEGLNLSLVGRIPFTNRFSMFGKVGGIYGWTRTSTATSASATEGGFDLSYGLGLQYELSRNWALRADVDQYRLKYSSRKDDVTAYTVGALYKF